MAKVFKRKKSEIVSSHQGVREDDVEFTSISFRDKVNLGVDTIFLLPIW